MGERRFVILDYRHIIVGGLPTITETELKRRFIEATQTIIVDHNTGEMVNWYEVLPVLLHGEEKDCVVHICPPNGGGLTPCCKRTPFELPREDRLTMDASLSTCHDTEEEEQLGDHYNPEVQPDVNNEWEDALKLCVEAIEILHPELDPKEPCVVYNAWNNAKKLLEHAEPVSAKSTLNDSFKYPYHLETNEPPKPTRKEWEEWAEIVADAVFPRDDRWDLLKQAILYIPGVPKE